MEQILIPSRHIPSLMRILCSSTMAMTTAVMTTTATTWVMAATMQVTSMKTRMTNTMVQLLDRQLKLMSSWRRHHVHFYYLTLVEYTNHIYSRKSLPGRHCRWHRATGLHQSHPAIYTQPRTSQLCFRYEPRYSPNILWQNYMLSVCRRHLPCAQRHLRCWWHAPWTHTSSEIVEKRPSTIQYNLCQYRSLHWWYVWPWHHSHATLLFIILQWNIHVHLCCGLVHMYGWCAK